MDAVSVSVPLAWACTGRSGIGEALKVGVRASAGDLGESPVGGRGG